MTQGGAALAAPPPVLHEYGPAVRIGLSAASALHGRLTSPAIAGSASLSMMVPANNQKIVSLERLAYYPQWPATSIFPRHS
jgi:hypothetical protein